MKSIFFFHDQIKLIEKPGGPVCQLTREENVYLLNVCNKSTGFTKGESQLRDVPSAMEMFVWILFILIYLTEERGKQFTKKGLISDHFREKSSLQLIALMYVPRS